MSAVTGAPVDFDVVVVGAGPAGSATARWLALAGWKVALLERSEFAHPRVGETLSPDVQPLLRSLGVWDEFLAGDPLPSWGVRSRWGDAQPQTHSHLLHPHGRGWHVDRRGFDRMLAEAAVRAGATLWIGTRACEIAPDVRGWRITLASEAGAQDRSAAPRLLRTSLWIDATGRRAQPARAQGARLLRFDRLVGIVAELDLPAARAHLAIEAAEHGWWYFAPIPGSPSDESRRMVTVLLTDADLCTRHRFNTPVAWSEALAATNEWTRGGLNASTLPALRVCGAGSQRLVRGTEGVANGNWLAVGDAAFAVDPVSGSGVVRALECARDAAAAAQDMHGAGGAGALAAYEHRRDLECDRYLHERGWYYGLEDRWPTALFWQRRRRVAGSVATAVR